MIPKVMVLALRALTSFVCKLAIIPVIMWFIVILAQSSRNPLNFLGNKRQKVLLLC